MGSIQTHKPVLLIAAITSRHASAIQWAIEKAIPVWGDVTLQSPVFDFTETDFYTKTMGQELKKQLIAFQPFDPTGLPETKIDSNAWEAEYTSGNSHAESRSINIDPGYISEAKLVLATTKDRDHRLYIRDGIFAEVTLHYHRGIWTKSRWTYPDYQRADFHQFFTECRDYLRAEIRKG